MVPAQIVYGQPCRQRTRVPDFKTVIENPHLDITGIGIVSVAHRIGDRFANSVQRILPLLGPFQFSLELHCHTGVTPDERHRLFDLIHNGSFNNLHVEKMNGVIALEARAP
jgi:hypothetical protein